MIPSEYLSGIKEDGSCGSSSDDSLENSVDNRTGRLSSITGALGYDGSSEFLQSDGGSSSRFFPRHSIMEQSGSSGSLSASQPQSSMRYLPSSKELAKTANEQKMMTANQLRFHALGVQGRHSEKAMLVSCLGNCNDGARELVLIDGKSGTGKSALAFTLTRPVKKMGGLLVKGRFDSLGEEPYAGIASACQEICGAIIQLDGQLDRRKKEKFQTIREEFIQKIGADMRLLTRIFPELAEIMANDLGGASKIRLGDTEKPMRVSSASFEISFV
jgi:hypothetical protein